jgi:glyoxylase-like metal-dependent hydrolase (beta-lactamase superfamily II)
MLLRQMEIGPAQNFQYFIGSEDTKEVAVVDPAWDVPFLLAEAERLGVRITHAFLSHGHQDHVNGVDELLAKTDVKVVVHEKDADFFGFQWPKGSVMRTRGGEVVRFGEVEVAMMHTPGHTPGSQSFLVRGRLVTGDTLFINGCGRCDFPGGDPVVMFDTLHHRVGALPDDTILLPGHNYDPKPQDTLSAQRTTNRFFLARDLDRFVEVRMGGKKS